MSSGFGVQDSVLVCSGFIAPDSVFRIRITQYSVFRIRCSVVSVQDSVLVFGVQGSVRSGFIVSRFGVQDSAFRIQCVQCSRFGVQGSVCSGFNVQGSVFRIRCSGCSAFRTFRVQCVQDVHDSVFRIQCVEDPVTTIRCSEF